MIWLARITATAFALLAYAIGCSRFAANADRLSITLAIAAWLLVAAGAARLWGLRRLGIGVAVAGAAVTTAVWSQLLVPFPAEWTDHLSPAVETVFLLSPFLLTISVGLLAVDRAVPASGLITALGFVGVHPVSMRNVEATAAGGWRGYGQYPYPDLWFCVTFVLFLLVAGALGMAAAYLGHRLRRVLHGPRRRRGAPG